MFAHLKAAFSSSSVRSAMSSSSSFRMTGSATTASTSEQAVIIINPISDTRFSSVLCPFVKLVLLSLDSETDWKSDFRPIQNVLRTNADTMFGLALTVSWGDFLMGGGTEKDGFKEASERFGDPAFLDSLVVTDR